jgi:hypothetical protein
VFETMKWRSAWGAAMTKLGYPDTAMDRGGTNRSNTGPVATTYFTRWRSESKGTSPEAFIDAHLDEIRQAVALPR